MKKIHLFKFQRHKYGPELLVDVITIDKMMHGIRMYPVFTENFFSIIMVTGGVGEVSVGTHTRLVGRGDVVCSRPGEVFSWQSESTLEGLALIFEEAFLLSFFRDSHFLDRFPYLCEGRPSPWLMPKDLDLWERLLHLLTQMRGEVESPEIDEHILRAMLYETLMLLLRADCPSAEAIAAPVSPVNRYGDMFVRLVNEDFAHHHDVEYYANKLCITPGYLGKVVRHTFGTTAKAQIDKRLLDEARHALAYTTLSVGEIADSLNFDTDSYFVRFFKHRTGLTPLEYRNCPNK